MKAHTPGPWTIEPHGNGYALYSGRDNTHHGLNLMNITEPDRNFKVNKPLIEAAPDLLMACEKALIHFEHLDIEKGVQEDLRIAIRKATGEPLAQDEKLNTNELFV